MFGRGSADFHVYFETPSILGIAIGFQYPVWAPLTRLAGTPSVVGPVARDLGNFAGIRLYAHYRAAFAVGGAPRP